MNGRRDAINPPAQPVLGDWNRFCTARFRLLPDPLEARNLREHLQQESLVLAESLAATAKPLIYNRTALQTLVERYRDQEQIAGVAIYDQKGQMLASTPGLVSELGNKPGSLIPADPEPATADFVESGGSYLHVAAVPIRAGNEKSPLLGRLIVFHQAGHIQTETATLWRRAFIGVVVQTLLILGITLWIVRRELRHPLLQMTQWLRDLRMGSDNEAPKNPTQELETLSREVTGWLRVSRPRAPPPRRKLACGKSPSRNGPRSVSRSSSKAVSMAAASTPSRIASLTSTSTYPAAAFNIRFLPVGWSRRSNQFCELVMGRGSRKEPAMPIVKLSMKTTASLSARSSAIHAAPRLAHARRR